MSKKKEIDKTERKINHPKRAAVITALVLLTVAAYTMFEMYHDRNPKLNLDVVEEGVLLRSGQPRAGDLDYILEKHGLGTVFGLRGDEEDYVTRWARARGVKMISIKMKADDPPTDAQIGLFFDVMRGDTIDYHVYQDLIIDNAGIGFNQPREKMPLPVLLHCEGGADRTGIMAALYRVAFDDWSVTRTKFEMISNWHIPPAHPKQFDFLEKMAPVIHPEYGSRMIGRKSESDPSPTNAFTEDGASAAEDSAETPAPPPPDAPAEALAPTRAESRAD